MTIPHTPKRFQIWLARVRGNMPPDLQKLADDHLDYLQMLAFNKGRNDYDAIYARLRPRLDAFKAACAAHENILTTAAKPKRKPVTKTDASVRDIAAKIGERFNTFGGGKIQAPNNPVSRTMKDRRLQFAAGVDVADVVRAVLSTSRNR